MRRILLTTRGVTTRSAAGFEHVPDDSAIVGGQQDETLVVLDDALQELARMDSRKAQVVELRFFGGLSVEETAEVLKVSAITVMRDWSTARAWLHREMSGGTPGGC